MQSAADIRHRAARVNLMVFDVDGVLTDGRLHYGPDGELFKSFHVHDGHGLKLLREAGVAIGLISGRTSAAVEQRARDLRIEHIALGVQDKPAVLDTMMSTVGATTATTGFMGDDWVDLAVMRRVGFAATVPNAANRMREHAHWVATRAGGEGAVRELAEFLLDARGVLQSAFEAHLSSGMAQG
ncbi:MAG TPA: HAD-IIIA family hydrolase [Burkholderiaceae bacterium]|nr:HAD-IIIA family hydrolase [Burkholderiaceae bacterium]